jgi:hypothetical protein
MGATRGGVTACFSGASVFTPNRKWGSCFSIFKFLCSVCKSLFVRFSIFSFGHCIVYRLTDSDYPLWYLSTLPNVLRHEYRENIALLFH